jgi:hypothetical protein
MSDLGHNDSQQPTTGNSLPPNNPPPSSASVPYTPAGILRRGHRNLHLLRPQVRYHSNAVPISKYLLHRISAATYISSVQSTIYYENKRIECSA